MVAPQAVFVHGRGQEFKDPVALRTKWLAGLNAGLTRVGSPTLAPEQVAFPYYGNVLYRITADSTGDRVRLEAIPTDEPGPLHTDLPEDVDALERELLVDLAHARGVEVPDGEVPDDDGAADGNDGGGGGGGGERDGAPLRGGVRPEGLRERVLSWKASRQLLSLLAKRSRVDQLIIAAQLRDVAIYLTRGRDAVLDAVRAAIPPDGPVVLVSHSLGTVVACDLLHDANLRDRTSLWVTTGSPLGLEAVQRNLLSPGRHHPGLPWLTAFDVTDVVALGHPLQPSWGAPLTDVEVSNRNDPHSISRYLAHPEVAGPIGDGMGRS